MKGITKRQQEVLDFIAEFSEHRGMPPTRRNITDRFNFKSPNAADEHLRALDRKGYINLIPKTSRGIEITGPTTSKNLPIIGSVAAGSPILAVEHVESQSTLKGSLFTPNADYLLRVQGESMINVGINDGDLLAVHKTNECRNHQIVVARIGDEVTVKRFRRKIGEATGVYLLAENEKFPTIEVEDNGIDFQIEGIGVGLIRTSM